MGIKEERAKSSQTTVKVERGRINGGTFIVVGDTHLTPRFRGSHKDYGLSGLKMLELIKDKVKEYYQDGKVSLCILGDVFGVNETSLNDEWYLARLNTWFKGVGELCEGRVFAVRGNHDMGEYTTFDYGVEMGWFTNPEYIDYTDEEGSVVYARYHIMNYGCEGREVNADAGIYNIMLGHNDYQIAGKTNWYGGNINRGSCVVVKDMKNLDNVQQIVSGHIHTPSPDLNMYELMPDGHRVNLLYTGSPARVAERVEDVYYVTYAPDEEDSHCSVHRMGLWGIEEEFNPQAKNDEELVENRRTAEQEEQLREILGVLMSTSALERFSIEAQLERIPGFSDEERAIAKEYYLKAVNKE